MAICNDSLRDAISRLLGQKVSMIRLEDMPYLLLRMERPLAITVEEAIERAWEKNR